MLAHLKMANVSKPKKFTLWSSIMMAIGPVVCCWTLNHSSYSMIRYASSWRLSLGSCFRDKSSYLDSNMNAFESFVFTAWWYITYKTARDCYTFWRWFILQNKFWPNLQNHFLEHISFYQKFRLWILWASCNCFVLRSWYFSAIVKLYM